MRMGRYYPQQISDDGQTKRLGTGPLAPPLPSGERSDRAAIRVRRCRTHREILSPSPQPSPRWREGARRVRGTSFAPPTAAAGVALALAGLIIRPAAADGVEDFYKGRTINLIIGYSVGGGYDLYARHVAKHIVKHIPGRPTIVPQNMTGAGS